MITTLFGKTSPRRRRSIENPAVPLSDPDHWLVDSLGGGQSASGIAVNVETALSHSAVWRAVNLLSRDVAKLPLLTYRRDRNGGKERAEGHPIYSLLKFKVNPTMTSFQFRQTITWHALIYGNGYASIGRRGGRIRELIPLSPVETTPIRENGRLLYVTRIKGETIKERSENILHIRGLGDGIWGFSVLKKARDSIGLGLATMRYGATFFKNNAHPGVVFEHPSSMSEEAASRLMKSWSSIHQGVENSHRAALLEEGMKLSTLGMPNTDAQFLETREFGLREIANWFGVPAHKVGDTTRTSFASLEQENQSYLDEALDPWLVAWESEIWDKCLTDDEKSSNDIFVEFLRQALVRANLNDRGAFYNLAIQGGWMNRDEVRSRENLNPIPDGEGEKFFVPMNMNLSGGVDSVLVPALDSGGDVNDDDDDDDAARSALMPVLGDAITRMAKRVSIHSLKQSKKPDGFIDWLETGLEDDHRGVVVDAFEPACRALGALTGAHLDAGEVAGVFFDAIRGELLGATDSLPAALPASVAKAGRRIREDLPGKISNQVFSENK